MWLIMCRVHDATAISLILHRGSVYLEHPTAGRPRLRLSVQGVEPSEATALRAHFRAGSAGGRRWSVVSAQARTVVQWVEHYLDLPRDVPLAGAEHFTRRLATLRVIDPTAVDGGRGTRKGRDTYDG